MKQHPIPGAALAVVIVFAALPVRPAAAEGWQLSHPSKEDMEKVVRKLWESTEFDKVFNPFADPVRPLCLTIPEYPPPSARSKTRSPMGWYLDFIPEAPLPSGRVKQLQQLDALSAVGLLTKTTTMNKESKEVTRYRLSASGWAAGAYSGGNGRCLVYGVSRFLGVSVVEPVAASLKAGVEIYDVNAMVGPGAESDLAPWARDPQVRAAFPVIDQILKGEVYRWRLVRGAGAWVDYSAMLQDGAEAFGESEPLTPDMAQIRAKQLAQAKQRLADLRALPTPGRDDLKAMVSKTMGQQSCLNLPGGSGSNQPVDVPLDSRKPSHYAVAIFTNKERNANDRVLKKTVPILTQLEQIGVLRKQHEHNLPGDGNDRGLVFDGDVYELTPALADKVSPDNPYCLPLGEPVREFVDFQVADNDGMGYPNPTVRYRTIVKYRNVPTWMNDPDLKSRWPELRGVIEDGMTCQGGFTYDKKTKERTNGSASCEWSFDSNQTTD